MLTSYLVKLLCNIMGCKGTRSASCNVDSDGKRVNNLLILELF